MLLPLRQFHETFSLLHRVHGVPWHHLVVDYLRFRRRIDARRMDFFTLGLWDRRVPMAERLRFLTDPNRKRIEYLMNPKAEVLALRDKGRVAARLAAAGIPVPETVALAGPGPADVPGAVRLTDAAVLVQLLGRGFPEGLVCKPNFGMAGRDVQVFVRAESTGLVHRNGESWSIDRLWQMLAGSTTLQDRLGERAGWKLERRVPPHPTLSAVHGPTLSCLRVVTFRRRDGRVQCLAPTWKIPVGDSGVDNLGAHSLTVAVDPVTGHLDTPLQQKTRCWHADHPETGARLAGMVLPHAAAAMDLARRTADCFPGLRSLGYDIGIAADGPVVVEVNPFWGSWLMQAPHRRGLLEGDFLEFLRELDNTRSVIGDR